VFRNKKDIVTHMPPILFGFRHVGEVVRIGQGLPDDDYHWPKCVGAHYPDKVYESLKAYEAEGNE